MTGARLRLGVDIGGTFTDLALVDDATGRVYIGKEPTVRDDPARGVLGALRSLLERHGLSISDVPQVIHATTLIANAIIERQGARTGLVTTRGFRDVLELGREIKYDLYDIFLPIPQPLVPRDLRLEVPERVAADGAVMVPLDPETVLGAADRLAEEGVEAIAVCFLHSYRNPAHEREAARLIEGRCPNVYVSTSETVASEIREYERTSTTVANAYVQPLTERYIGNLAKGLRDTGFSGRVHLMLSSGGLAGVRDAVGRPIQLLESGPAAGAIVGGFYARLGGHDRALTFDMGGTTVKMCIVDDGAPIVTYRIETARERRFKRGSGLPILITSVDLIEIGAGGGSIARINARGGLNVGPLSAGADPGPACYGRGGREPTVTDADVVLGYYDPDYFLGGTMKLDLEAARAAVGTIASRLGVGLVEAAWGIHNIVNEQMASAARIHVADRGRDVRRYSLLATGGAGPCHGPCVAEKLQIRQVICPPSAGVASALGLLAAPARVDLARSRPTRIANLDIDALERLYEEMMGEALDMLAEAGVAAGDVRFTRAADMRYVGQGFEVSVSLAGEPGTPGARDELGRCFEEAYRKAFARSIPDAPVEALTWRLTATGPPHPVDYFAPVDGQRARIAMDAPRGSRPVYFPQWREHRPVQVLDRYALGPGLAGTGPAILEERESTAVVPPGASWRVDETLSLVITLEEPQA